MNLRPLRKLISGPVEIYTVPALDDNYCYLIRRAGTKTCAVVDPSTAAPIRKALAELGLTLDLILNTHHHHDHIGGNEDLLSENPKLPVFCSSYDKPRIPQATRGFGDGESFEYQNLAGQVLSIPGHTLGQIAFHFPEARALFVGDTLFSMGCGRLFEGSAQTMWESFAKIKSLPPETRIFFGHEYTDKNGLFALTVEPNNLRIRERMDQTKKDLATYSSARAPSLFEELEVNPFLRAPDALAFAHRRSLRDKF